MRLTEWVSKGVKLIVTDGRPESPPLSESIQDVPSAAEPEPASTAAAETPAPTSAVPATVSSFDDVYAEAGVQPPAHGYGVDKVAEMLQSSRLATLARDVRATAVLAALEAAGVDVRDLVRDAVKRDAALDAFEAAKDQELKQLREQTEARVQSLNQELERIVAEKRAEIEGLKQASDAAAEAFAALQNRKRREEERLFEVVSHFVAENPITTRAANPSPTSGGTA